MVVATSMDPGQEVTPAAKTLVVGNSGQLAQALAHVCQTALHFRGGKGHDFFDLDLTKRLIGELGVEKIINTAAYTAVDLAESEPDAAARLNVVLPVTLAHAAKQTGAGLIHISTDYVFDGEKPIGELYRPEDKTNPINVYGQTKLEGERGVQAADDRAVILRTSWLHSPFGKNFRTAMEGLLCEREEIGVVADQWGTPTDARDLARHCLSLDPLRPGPRLRHFSGGVSMTWFDLAQIFKAALPYARAILRPVATSAYPTAARRGVNTGLALAPPSNKPAC